MAAPSGLICVFMRRIFAHMRVQHRSQQHPTQSAKSWFGDNRRSANGILPFPDDTFDAAWMQNVGMNIADKRKLYGEVCRVLKPGGRFAFQEMSAGTEPTIYFPLPWASDPADNFLVSADEMHQLLSECGFIADTFEDATDMILNSPPPVSATPASVVPVAATQPPLGLSVFVDNLAEKAGNARRSLQEGRVRFVRGVFRVK